jgi:hypothetical protein
MCMCVCVVYIRITFVYEQLSEGGLDPLQCVCVCVCGVHSVKYYIMYNIYRRRGHTHRNSLFTHRRILDYSRPLARTHITCTPALPFTRSLARSPYTAKLLSYTRVHRPTRSDVTFTRTYIYIIQHTL